MEFKVPPRKTLTVDFGDRKVLMTFPTMQDLADHDEAMANRPGEAAQILEEFFKNRGMDLADFRSLESSTISDIFQILIGQKKT